MGTQGCVREISMINTVLSREKVLTQYLLLFTVCTFMNSTNSLPKWLISFLNLVWFQSLQIKQNTFFILFLNFVTVWFYLFICLFVYLLAAPSCLWDLCSPTRGPGIEPNPLAVKAPSPNHWTAREFPTLILYFKNVSTFFIFCLSLISHFNYIIIIN